MSSVGSDSHFGRGYIGRPRQVFPDEQDALGAVTQWKYWDYLERCVGWFGQQRFAEMAFNGNNLMV